MIPTFLRCLGFALLCFLSMPTSSRGTDAAPFALSDIPPALAAPAGQQAVLVLSARGVQIYACRPVPGDPAKFEWAFQAPEADLFDPRGTKVGHHYAGPTWELTDGSNVIGRLKAKADAPDGKGIAWLLLEASEHHGTGALDKVLSIQRVSTVGGKNPAEAADQSKAGQERRVEYTATYVFYVAKP